MLVTQTKVLTPYQVTRYSRHIIMPQVGSKGQRKLLDAKVLVIGAGGLGSPISIYLTLAGVGTIGILSLAFAMKSFARLCWVIPAIAATARSL